MNALSLFSGIGGIDLAAEWAGIHTVAFCEKEPYCRKILAKHWPGVPIFEDVFTLKGEDIGETVDIIHGGFPCQPFSVAGRQRGQNDDRYLWPEFSRLVGELRPRWVVAENVPGILRIAADNVCQDLERLGYSVGIWDYEAAAVGAMHRRERVFFVGYAERSGLPRIARRGTGAGLANGCSDDIFDTSIERLSNWTGVAMGRRKSKPESQRSDSGLASDADRQQCEEQLCAVADETEQRTAGCRGRRQLKSGFCRELNGFPEGLDRLVIDESIPKTARGAPNRVARLKALGNAVVPQQIYPIFRAIKEIEGHESIS